MKQYIYESPDKGKTIYRREFGSLDKELMSRSYEIKYEPRFNDISYANTVTYKAEIDSSGKLRILDRIVD